MWGCKEVLGEVRGSVEGGIGKCRDVRERIGKCVGRCGGCGEALVINLEL